LGGWVGYGSRVAPHQAFFGTRDGIACPFLVKTGSWSGDQNHDYHLYYLKSDGYILRSGIVENFYRAENNLFLKRTELMGPAGFEPATSAV
jgi:hypothetical protein